MFATIAEWLKALGLLSDFECAGSNPASNQKIQISFTFVDAFFILMKLLCTRVVEGKGEILSFYRAVWCSVSFKTRAIFSSTYTQILYRILYHI